MVCLVPLLLALFASQASAPSPAQPNEPPSQPSTSSDSSTPAPTPDASGIYHVGHGVLPPRIASRLWPEYSEEARKAKLSGVTILSLIIDANGNPSDVTVLHSIADTVSPKYRKAALSLDEKALEAVKQYKFQPATLQGVPVPVHVKIQVSFQVH